MALLRPPSGSGASRHVVLVALGLFGAALLYGDGIITPAISVLSAVEGLELATPAFKPYVLPIAVVILIALFLFQKQGTGGSRRGLRPGHGLWFVALAVLGVVHIVDAPAGPRGRQPAPRRPLLRRQRRAPASSSSARSSSSSPAARPSTPTWATSGRSRSASAGSRSSSRRSSSTTSARGRSSSRTRRPPRTRSSSSPRSGRSCPLVLLATAASVIASQAVISGAFSLTRQAVQLGYMPRLRIDHTSEKEIGQIYLPSINWALVARVHLARPRFRTSSALAAAYGVAVTTTMGITTVLLYVYAREAWKVSRAVALPVAPRFLVVDLAFFGANIVKIAARRLVPARRRRLRLHAHDDLEDGAGSSSPSACRRRRSRSTSSSQDVEKRSPTRVPGTAVFMDRIPRGDPAAPAPQPQAQQGPPRARRLPDGRHRRGAAREGRGADARRVPRRRASGGSRSTTASWRTPTSRARSASSSSTARDSS